MLLTLVLAAWASPASAGAFLPLVSPPPGTQDSLREPTVEPLASARSAYQAAWTLREAKDPEAAVRTAERALDDLAKALQGDVDASTRRELVDIQSKLSGLRDAAKAQRAAPDSSNDTADAQVLNAPAIEDIEPQVNAEVHRYIE